MTFPFTLAELQKHFAALNPVSFVAPSDAAFWMQANQLAILARSDHPLLDQFHGDSTAY